MHAANDTAATAQVDVEAGRSGRGERAEVNGPPAAQALAESRANLVAPLLRAARRAPGEPPNGRARALAPGQRRRRRRLDKNFVD